MAAAAWRTRVVVWCCRPERGSHETDAQSAVRDLQRPGNADAGSRGHPRMCCPQRVPAGSHRDGQGFTSSGSSTRAAGPSRPPEAMMCVSTARAIDRGSPTYPSTSAAARSSSSSPSGRDRAAPPVTGQASVPPAALAAPRLVRLLLSRSSPGSMAPRRIVRAEHGTEVLISGGLRLSGSGRASGTMKYGVGRGATPGHTVASEAPSTRRCGMSGPCSSVHGGPNG